MKTYLLPLLLLSACNATGAAYSGKENGNLVIYRPAHLVYSVGYYYIDINGIEACGLGNGGFFTRQINGPTNISSSIWNQPGTSRITVNPNKEKTYIKIQSDNSKIVAGAAAGLAGQLAGEGISSTGGPFLFTQVPADTAKKELRGLNQDCM